MAAYLNGLTGGLEAKTDVSHIAEETQMYLNQKWDEGS